MLSANFKPKTTAAAERSSLARARLSCYNIGVKPVGFSPTKIVGFALFLNGLGNIDRELHTRGPRKNSRGKRIKRISSVNEHFW